MSIVSAQGLAKYYGAQDVFANIEFTIAHGDKVALVGPNGAGKTTLLRILLGLEEATAGSVQRARSLRLGYLPQKPTFPSDQTLYAEMVSVFEALRRQQQALWVMAEEMAAAPDSAALLQRYAEMEHRFDLAGGYTYEERIKRVLGGLSFGAEMYEWPITVLSGGQVTRALLAKLLLLEPDLLVLDEPTNYLDLSALEWLETYLQEWPQSLLIVSHDRYFLNRVVSRVWEMNHGTLETYRGNYSSYVVQREDRRERQLKDFLEQQEQIGETEDYIRRYKAGQRARQAKGREVRLNRLERLVAPPPDRHVKLHITTALRAGDNVLMSDGVSIGYPAKPQTLSGAEDTGGPHLLFQSGPFLIRRGQRVCLLGPNGSGKTTFLRTILQEMEPLEGQVRLGASVRVGYLPQKQDWLDPNLTVLDQILAEGKLLPDQVRHLMGRFLFSGDDIYKSIGTLSGGELSRVALAILTLRGANLLLLDEPTTHLDVDSQEILQDVLTNFPGTILFVSHDRYLMDALATHLWVIGEGGMRVWEGNYTSYQQELERERLVRQEVQEKPTGTQVREERRRGRQTQRAARQRAEQTTALESEIEHLEGELGTLTGLMDLASANHDVARVQSLSHEYQRVERSLSERMEEWEQMVSAPEEE
jgi:ATP-binding cassette subfamily F protein 3